VSNRPLVLLVEDFEDARELAAEYLRDSGFEVATAGDGAEAIARAAELAPALIILDLVLPIVDGWEAIRRLREDSQTRLIPIIVTSGNKSDDDRRRCAELGCVGYLQKPCPPATLVAKIREALHD
jgi:CheY-like chemotaxis protein